MKLAMVGAVLSVLMCGASLPVAAATPAASPAATAPAAAAGSPSPAAAGSPGPASSNAPDDGDAKAALRAKEWLGRLQKGSLDRTQLTPDLNAGLQDATIAGLAKQYGPLGTPQKIVLLDKHAADGMTTWTFKVTWPSQSLEYSFGIEMASGKISALYLRPGKTT